MDRIVRVVVLERWVNLGMLGALALVLSLAGCNDDASSPGAGHGDIGPPDLAPSDLSGVDRSADLGKVPDASPQTDGGPDGADAAVTPDGPASPDAGSPPSASGTFDSKGGSVSVALTGLITRIRLDLPAGSLAATEKVKLTLNAQQALPTDHPSVGGAVYASGFSLDVDPPSLRKKVELALGLRVTLSSVGLPAAQQAELYKDALAWTERYLLASDREAQVESTAAPVPLCKYTPPIKHTPLRIDWNLFEKKVYNTGTHIAYTVELAGHYLLIRHRYGLGTAYRPSVLKGKAYRFWRTIIPMQKPFELPPHKHIGPVIFRYFPISVGPPKSTGWKPTKAWPAAAAHRALVKKCLGTFVRAALDPLAAKTFHGLRWSYPAGYGQWHNVIKKQYGITGKYGGDYLPYVVFIYDYSTSPDVAATTNMWLRTMRLPTKVVDPALYTTASCFTSQVKDLVASIGHEVFHWQQGAYLMPQTPGKLDPGYYAFFNQTKTTKHGPYDLTSQMTYYTHEWIYEGTAQYFDSLFVRKQGYWVRRGLASYPLDRPPWRMEGAKLWAALHGRNTYWSYYRYFFFKYLFDQEKTSGVTDELGGLKDLLFDLETEQILKGAKARYTPVVKKWMDDPKRKLSWFGWLRELLLLRGCSKVSGKDGCPDIPKAMTFPFAYTASSGADPFGQTEQADQWASFIPKGKRRWEVKVNPYASLPPGFNPKSWTAGGRTLKRSGVCNFDSNEPAYQKSGLKDGAGVLIPDAQTILKSGPVTITLPRNVQFRMAGSRLDIKDNLPKRLVASKYRWTITRGTACAGDLELETHRFTREASKVATESFKFLKRSTGATLVFDITLAGGSPMAIGEAWVYLLAGNTSWTKDAANPKAHCTISVGIQEIK